MAKRKNLESPQAASPPPPDQAEREAILQCLDTSMLVEASAGSGKTTSMVGRMVGLLREGKCGVETLAAITFTRKSAAELRARFQVALEKAVREADGLARQRLVEAVDHLERCFIGTIHSFCGRLLRERPVEAGLDLAFQELDDATDARLQEEAWEQYVARRIASGDALLGELAELGLEIGQLRLPFIEFVKYPDVDDWPAEAVELPNLDPVREAIDDYLEHIAALLPTLPDDAGSDTLMPKLKRLARIARQIDLKETPRLMDFLAEFTAAKVTQKQWPGKKAQALEEQDRWDRFREGTAEPLLERWREKRYPVVLRVLREAQREYDRRRRELGGLNYQDLLLQAASLLRGKPAVRRYFRRRFTHLLVDEFQDTDPIQAEVMLLLTADNAEQDDWRNCRPVSGSLFVVGDPKQSIYRFRRADIVTYNAVRAMIERDGRVISLWANFRSTRPVIDWVNRIFETEFPATADPYSPSRRSMECGKSGGDDLGPQSVCVLRVPEEFKTNDEAVEYEADFIARTIQAEIDRSAKTSSDGDRVKPGDFLIVSTRKRNLGIYAQKLAERGIPSQVTGGSVLNEVREIGLACLCLEAITQPDNPVALVAALRSELFGVSDAALYAFKRAGGTFSLDGGWPEELKKDASHQPILDAIHRLRRYATWLRRLPPVAAIERVLADLGLTASAATRSAANVHAGSLAKAVELLRKAQTEAYSINDLVAYLRTLVDGEELHDGMAAIPAAQVPVRIMNLHQVKGLEAPLVFLADPTGKSEHGATLHIDRSEARTRGYLAIHGPSRGFGRGPLLACPANWERLAEEEDKFYAAERKRLNYVAATRAGQRLTVTLRTKGNQWNSWAYFGDWLSECPDLGEPGRCEPKRPEPVTIAEEEPLRAVAMMTERWQAVMRPTYATAAAKAISVTPMQPLPVAGEHGTEWGSVIHLLLEVAMVRPSDDLLGLAYESLSQLGLDPALAEKAVETVRSVRQSEIWQRALASPRRLAEVPFQMLEDCEGGIPRILRGVIDLVFLEDGGWVIVDYKTDARPVEYLPALVEHYEGQVRTYAKHWAEITGEPVREAGLYFTHISRYVPVGL